MTLAICVRCGQEKVGALTPCSSCGFLPRSFEDLAKSITLSDRHYDREALWHIADRIRSGKSFDFDEDAIARLAVELETDGGNLKMPLGCQLAVWTPVVVMCLLAAALIALVIYLMAG